MRLKKSEVEVSETRSEKEIRELDIENWFDKTIDVFADWTMVSLLERFREWVLEDSEK